MFSMDSPTLFAATRASGLSMEQKESEGKCCFSFSTSS